MKDFLERLTNGQTISEPHGYVRKAACNFFLKACRRERQFEHLLLLLQSYPHPVEGPAEDQLAAREEEEDVESKLWRLPPAQREVFKLLMEGLSTTEIVQRLGKTPENIRQLRKKGRDRLKKDPSIASRPEHALKPTLLKHKPRKEGV